MVLPTVGAGEGTLAAVGGASGPGASETGRTGNVAALRAVSRAPASSVDGGRREGRCIRIRPTAVWYVRGSVGGAHGQGSGSRR